jgi:hypothetical protein
MKIDLNRIAALLLIAVVSCNEPDIPAPLKKKDWIEKIKVKDEEQLLSALNSLGVKRSSSGRTASTNFGELNVDEALKVLDTANHATRYSLSLKPRTNRFVYENLVISRKDDGTTHTYIMQLEPDFSWLRKNENLESFTGFARQLDLDRKVLIEKQIGGGVSRTSGGRVQVCCTWEIYTSSTTGYQYLEIKCGGDVYVTFRTKEDCGGGDPAPPPGPDTGDGGGDSGSDGSNDGGGQGGTTTNTTGDKIGFFMTDLDMERTQRLLDVENLLLQDPNKLIKLPCTELQKWQSVGSFKPPQSVVDKINNLKENYPGAEALFTGNFKIQTLQDASGKAVNMDYFSVKVNQLPNINGQTATAGEFLNHIRKNLNSFVDTQYSNFSPYNEVPTGVDEATLWNSTSPLNAIIHIQIPGNSVLGDDGSVICSDHSASSWKFTTISAPWDWSHPVSGTREFGYESHADGSFTFYTRGVDRITQGINELLAESKSFSEADNLWESFQDKIKEFVTLNGGSAVKNSPIKGRPDWAKLAEVINGTKPPSSLGCY